MQKFKGDTVKHLFTLLFHGHIVFLTLSDSNQDKPMSGKILGEKKEYMSKIEIHV